MAHYSRRSAELHLRRYPAGTLERDCFEVVDVQVPEPVAGEILVRNRWTSVDPGMRLRLRADAPAGYFPRFDLHAALDGIMTVGVVVESRDPDFAPGDTVWHPFGWRELAVLDAHGRWMNGLATPRVLDVDRARAEAYLGPLGPMGLTAYSGLAVMDALDGGGRLWVSAAAGAVGLLAVQAALRIGHEVVASAGSDEKVDLLRRLGAKAFNYRSTSVGAGLAEFAPGGIDFYFDNVGGDHLEAALGHLRPGGRLALCGSISDYEGAAAGPRNLFQATAKGLTLTGFRGSLHLDLLPVAQSLFSELLAAGSLHYPIAVYEGLAAAPQALSDSLRGVTTGKALVRL